MRKSGLLAIAAACLSTAAMAQSTQIGVFIGGWNSSAMPANLSAYETALGRSMKLIDQFNGENYAWTGANSIARSAGWLMSQPNKSVARAPRQLSYGLHLGILRPYPVNTIGLSKAQFDAQGFNEIAAGLHDDAYRSVGKSLVKAGFPDTIVRLGQEANGDWFPGCACSDQPNFAAAFNHVAALLRAISPRFTIVLDMSADRAVAKYTTGIDWSLVDAINLDFYDNASYGATPEARWRYLLSHGIDEWLTLGKSVHRPLMILEWAVGKAGDNRYMVNQVAQLAANPANNIIAMVYWQSGSAYSGVLSPTVNPLAWADYVKRFGQAP